MQVSLRCMKYITRRQIIARFRIGSHWLQVQVGRFQVTERSSRICEQCSVQELEDDEHALISS
jgi:hypothetical protein